MCVGENSVLLGNRRKHYIHTVRTCTYNNIYVCILVDAAQAKR